MRIRSWVRLLLGCLSVAASAQQSISLASGLTIAATATSTRTTLHLRGEHHAREQRVSLLRDADVAPGPNPPRLKLVAELPGAAVVLTDSYRSKPGGLAFCQAGEEQFLRVLTLTGRRPVESFHVKLASCRESIELADPGVEWSAADRTLRLHWLTPTAGQPTDLTVTLAPDGRPLGRKSTP